MAAANEDRLSEMLSDGWTISGYSTTIMAAGAMTHAILLQKGASLVSMTAVTQGDQETGRIFIDIAPKPEKKGWF